MNPGILLSVMSARRVVDQMPAMLGFPSGRRGAGPFMSGAGLPLPLACAKAGSGAQRMEIVRPIAIHDRYVLTMISPCTSAAQLTGIVCFQIICLGFTPMLHG